MKKFLKILGVVFLVLFGSFCALVLVCAVKPEVTQAIADFLYPNRQSSVQGEVGDLGPEGESASYAEFDGKNQVEETFSLGEPGREEWEGEEKAEAAAETEVMDDIDRALGGL